MKKIYFSFLFIAGALQISNAQLSLTKAFNEPVIGDIHNTQRYDSTTAIPKNTGAGQSWNFNTLVQQATYENSTFTTVASTPSASAFPGTTLAEDQGAGSYQMYKITSTNFEVSGIQFPGAVINLSNTAVFAVWPVNFGYSLTDGFAGSSTTGTVTTSITGGIINISGAGTGTVTMPGGLVLTNCLQVVQTDTLTLAQNTFTQYQVEKEYKYYHSSNKFPLLSIKYQTTTSGTVVTKNIDIYVNNAVVAGITTNQLNNDFSVFPNPAHGSINVALTNNSNFPVSATLTNMLGQVVMTENLGNTSLIRSSVNVSSLPKGLYFMNIKVGEATTLKKIVIE